jgi:thioredoxin-related protein
MKPHPPLKESLKVIAVMAFIIAALIFISISVPGCIHKIETMPVREISNANIKSNAVQILTIGKHEYLWVSTTTGGGLCHYEDCKYCERMKQTTIKPQ